MLFIIHNVETPNPTFFLCLPDMYMHELQLACPVVVFCYSNISCLQHHFSLLSFLCSLAECIFTLKVQLCQKCKILRSQTNKGTLKMCCKSGVANFFLYESQYMMSGSITGCTLLDRTEIKILYLITIFVKSFYYWEKNIKYKIHD
jgi:hypothetical protein